MNIQEELQKLRREARGLRQQIASKGRTWLAQNKKVSKLEKKVKQLEQQNKKLEQDNQELTEENESLKQELNKSNEQKETFKRMIFKLNTRKAGSTKKRGGQLGHKGTSRKKPKRVDQEKECYLSHCPDCNKELEQSNAIYERIVEDIPIPQTIITRYHIQRQYCSCCQKEVHAIPENTLPNFRFGLNLIGWILMHKYRLRVPLNRMVESLKEQYGLKISQGGIQNILNQLKNKFGHQYQKILKKVKKANIKYADETSWRIMGQNSWCWLFASSKASYYTIEEGRGKGVAQRILGKYPKGLLVRDDYRAYSKLPLEQQSCWAHLLRKSYEAVSRDGSSGEVKNLHQELKTIFQELKMITETKFKEKERKQAYFKYQEKIIKIQNRKYKNKDVKAIQERIINQGNNLINALKYPNAPLTNNHAERQIRTMVVTRKISGGSQSVKGADTHAVNMSVIQTLCLEGKSIFRGVKNLLALPLHNLSLEKAEY